MRMTCVLFFALAAASQAQDGSDINQAVPIYFGQTVNDTIDATTKQIQVYSITLARGQSFSATAKTNNGVRAVWCLGLLASTFKTISGFSCGDGRYLATNGASGTTAAALTWNYQVAAAGVYYVVLHAVGTGINYSLQVTADGTPIGVPNPTSAGCVNGQIDSMTYSLQLIAAGLPDEVSIGGTRLCATCTVKPPAYPQLVNKMEAAMSLNVGVSACYDAAGNIFQLKLLHP